MEIVGVILALILLLGGVGVLLFALFFWPRENGERLPGRSGTIVGAIVAIALFIILSSIKVVGAGEIGVVKHFGAVEDNERGPGINFVIPFFTDIVNVNGRVQGIHFENLAAASKEYQDVFLTGTLNVHVDPTAAADLYQRVGLDYDTKLVIPFYTNIVKEIVPQFGVAEVLPKRELIRQLTVEKLRVKLQPYGIVVDDVALANVNFNENYNQAIQDKQIQELRVQTERNILQQRTIQAQQAVEQAKGEAAANVEKAKGEALSNVERAKGDAQASVERANGQATANRLISDSLSNDLLTWQAINQLYDNIKFGLIPNDNGLLLDPSKMFPE